MDGSRRRWNPPEFSAPGHLPLRDRILHARGILDPREQDRFLEPKLDHLAPEWSLPGAIAVAERLASAIQARQRIVIYGDYDVDGITATAILFHALCRGLRFVHPDVSEEETLALIRSYVPHRLDEGYGLNAEALTHLKVSGADLVISVDCGISAIDAAAHAKAIGLELIITDHHALPTTGELPDALCAHPLLPGFEPGFGDLCGAGVAFKVAILTLRKLIGLPDTREQRLPKNLSRFMLHLLPLAAMGTIADVVPLRDENRVIVRQGLRLLPELPGEGLTALIHASRLGDAGERRLPQIDCERVGFQLAPRLNAVGRLGHAAEAVELLTTATGARAAQIAAQLDAINSKRQKMGQEIFEQAAEEAEALLSREPNRRTIVLARDDWHPGIVGITCSRLVERLNRPTILLCGDDAKPDLLRGSGRSISGFSLFGALSACADHLGKFGGHEMAAGLALTRPALPAFIAAIEAHAQRLLTPEDLVPQFRYDCTADLNELHPSSIRSLRDLAPFGRGNPTPVVRIDDLMIDDVRAMGQSGNHRALTLRSRNGGAGRAVLWGGGMLDDQALVRGLRVDLLAAPKLNVFRGREEVDLHIRDLRIRSHRHDASVDNRTEASFVLPPAGVGGPQRTGPPGAID